MTAHTPLHLPPDRRSWDRNIWQTCCLESNPDSLKWFVSRVLYQRPDPLRSALNHRNSCLSANTQTSPQSSNPAAPTHSSSVKNTCKLGLIIIIFLSMVLVQWFLDTCRYKKNYHYLLQQFIVPEWSLGNSHIEEWAWTQMLLLLPREWPVIRQANVAYVNTPLQTKCCRSHVWLCCVMFLKCKKKKRYKLLELL